MINRLILCVLLLVSRAALGELIAFDSFDHTLGTVVAEGGVLGSAENGFYGGWAFSGLTGEVVGNLACGGVKSTGNALKISNVTNASGYLFRGMDSSLPAGTYYMSMVFYRDDTNGGGGENWSWALKSSSSYTAGPTSTNLISAGSTSTEQASVTAYGGFAQSGTATYTVTNTGFMLLKFMIQTNGSETASIKIFNDGEDVPVVDSGISWDATSTGSFSGGAGWRFTLPASIPVMTLDEFRLGTELEDVVTSPKDTVIGSGLDDYHDVLGHTFVTTCRYRVSGVSGASNCYVNANAYSDGAAVNLQSTVQQWLFDELDAGQSLYRLRCANNDAYSLRAVGGTDGWNSGDNVTVHSWNNWDSQKWIVTPGTNGLAKLRLKLNSQSLYVDRTGLSNNAPVQLSGSSEEKWEIEPVENIQSPNITIGTDGDLLASFKYLSVDGNNGMLYASSDGGATWTLRKKFDDGVYGQTIFPLNGALYMIYNEPEDYTELKLAKSTDHGYFWSDHTITSLPYIVTSGGAEEVIVNGILYYAFIDRGGSGGGQGTFRLRVASCPTNSDLTVSTNWTITAPAAFPSSPAVSGTGGGWLEPNCVQGPDGKIWVVARVDKADTGNVAAVLKVSADRTTLEFANQYPALGTETGFIEADWAGSSKFHILYDDVSERYLVMSNPYCGAPSANSRHPYVRNILALYESYDLKHFSLVKTLVNDDSYEDWALSSWYSGFQYPAFVIDGSDLHYITRTAYRTFCNYHDANKAVYHRLENFRDYLSPDGEVAFYSFDSTNYPGANSSKMGGSDADVYNATFNSTGKYGGSLSFNGTNSWVGLMHRVSPKLHRSGQICVSVWMKSSVTTSPGAIITSPINGTTAGYSMQCLYGKIVLGGRSCISDSFQTRDFSLPPSGTWHHLVALWDFENDDLRLWVDAVEQTGTGTVAFAESRYLRSAPGVQDTVGKNYANTYYFNGELDELHIYRRALNQAEINGLYAGETECKLSGSFVLKNRNPYYRLFLSQLTDEQLSFNRWNAGIKSQAQSWELVPLDGGVRYYVKVGENLYLNGGYSNGVNVAVVYSETAPTPNSYKWRPLYLGNGEYRLQSAADDYLRADGDDGWDDGDNVEILEWQGWNSQRWFLYPLD